MSPYKRVETLIYPGEEESGPQREPDSENTRVTRMPGPRS